MSVKSATAIDKCNKTDREINLWVVIPVVIAMRHPPTEIAIVEEEIRDPAEIAPHNLLKTTAHRLVREITTGRGRRKLTVL
jgi:hypothetical protein